MRATSWFGRRLTAVAGAVAVLALGAGEAPAQDGNPNTGRISLSAGVDYTTDYYFRGIVQETEDYIIQPYGDITFRLWDGAGGVGNLALTVGTWNSLHGGPTGIEGGSASADPKIWYESDFYAKLGATVLDGLTAQTIYTAYMSPNNRFDTVQEIAFGLSYNDSTLLGPFAVNPSALVAFELRGQADAGDHRGVYLQLGVAPGYTFNAKGAYPLALSFPITLGLSLSDYYEFGTGDDDTFGFLQAGPSVAVPLAFIPSGFGPWQAKAGVAWLHLGDNLRAINENDRNEFIGTIGIALAY
ncbi:MAG: hypothetical protein ACREJG_01805 [Candidatus Rokuibacteriota bacterium]